jgi:hypothetical protein
MLFATPVATMPSKNLSWPEEDVESQMLVKIAQFVQELKMWDTA